MPGKPQITAKLDMDATGLQRSLRTVKGSLKGFASDVGRQMKRVAVAGMAGVAAGVGAALKNGFDQKVMLEQSETLMQSLMGGAEKARGAMAMLAAEAKQNPMFSRSSMVAAGAALANYAGGSTQKLQGLVETAEKLSILNKAQGIGGAAHAIKEALGGDYVSLAERFDIPKSTIKSLKEAGLEGKALIDQVLKMQGIDDKTLAAQANTVGGQMDALKSTWDDFSINLMEGLWPTIQENIAKVLAILQDNAGAITTGIQRIAETVAKLVELITKALAKFDSGTQAAADKWFAPENEIRKKMDVVTGTVGNLFSGKGLVESYKQAQSDTDGAQLGDRAKQVLKERGASATLRIDVVGMNGLPSRMMGAS